MSAGKKFLLFIISVALFGSLTTAAFAAATAATIGSKDTLKRWVNQSGVYDGAVDAVIESINSKPPAEGEQYDPLRDPAVKTALTSVLTPQYLRTTSENAIDGLYDWLGGTTEKPELRIDLADAKTRLANALGTVAADRLSTLPPCTVRPAAENIDPFSLNCLPPGTNPQDYSRLVTDQFLGNPEFMGDGTVTADAITVPQNGRDVPFYQAAADAPTWYQLGRLLPYIAGGMAVVLSVVLLLLYPSKVRGLRRIGSLLLFAAGLLGVTWGLAALAGQYGGSVLAAQSHPLSGMGSKLIASAAQDFIAVQRLFVLGYAVLGLVLVVLTLINRKRKTSNAQPTDAAPPKPKTFTSDDAAGQFEDITPQPQSPTAPAAEPHTAAPPPDKPSLKPGAPLPPRKSKPSRKIQL